MNRVGETEIPNSTDNDEAMAPDLEKQINTKEYLNGEFVSNDEAIAKELQREIDREYNRNLKQLEELRNGTSKLNISYEKYRNDDSYDGYGEEDFEDFDQEDDVDCDRFAEVDRNLLTKNGNMVKKHDVSLNRRKNVKCLMSLPPNVQAGEEAASRMEISDTVLNSLNQHISKSKIKFDQNLNQHDESLKKVYHRDNNENKLRKLYKRKKTYLERLDQGTQDNLNGLRGGGLPCLKRLYKKIGEGKKSVVYRGKIAVKSAEDFCGCALKLYKLGVDVDEFKLQEKYISGDYRYKDRYDSEMSNYKIACLWAEKEGDNLKRLKVHDISCPEVITLRNNVLVTSLIGHKYIIAKSLNCADMRTWEYTKAYEQIVSDMSKMFKQALLVHTNLSADNILYHSWKCYFVNLSQAVDVSHEFAFRYLMKDCKKVTEFFKKKKADKVMTKEKLFKNITGVDFNDHDGLKLLRTTFRKKRASKRVNTN